MDKEKVQAVIDKDIRPMLQADGGDIELVSVEKDGTIKVKLTGACGGCPMAQMTLQMGVHRRLARDFPEIKEVVSV